MMMLTAGMVPDDLAELDQWVLWRFENRNGNSTKVPFHVSGKPASSTDPTTWEPFDVALAAWAKSPRRYAGFGFRFLP